MPPSWLTQDDVPSTGIHSRVPELKHLSSQGLNVEVGENEGNYGHYLPSPGRLIGSMEKVSASQAPNPDT